MPPGRERTLTDIIDIPRGVSQKAGGATKGHLAVGGGLHLNIAVLCVLGAGHAWWVSDGGIGVLAIQGARAVAAHGVLDVIC